MEKSSPGFVKFMYEVQRSLKITYVKWVLSSQYGVSPSCQWRG